MATSPGRDDAGEHVVVEDDALKGELEGQMETGMSPLRRKKSTS